jgi:hypothetical protein
VNAAAVADAAVAAVLTALVALVALDTAASTIASEAMPVSKSVDSEESH